jgi:uridine phosphorylase
VRVVVEKKLKSATNPEDSESRQYHIMVLPGDIANYILLPGDPSRIDLIASYMDSYKLVGYHREYRTITGFYKGIKISATSTGIGGPSSSIAVEELLRAGAKTFIRVGTCGAIKSKINVGDLIIATGSFRLDGASLDYVDKGYPALANYEIINALIQSADGSNANYHVGLVASTDTFYVGQGRPGFNGFISKNKEHIIEELSKVNVLAFEMEASTIFTLSQIYSARAGCICAVIANRITDEFIANAGIESMIKVSLEAVKILAEWDSLKANKNKKWFYPDLINSKSTL